MEVWFVVCGECVHAGHVGSRGVCVRTEDDCENVGDVVSVW